VRDAQPFHQADLSTALRLSLKHAKLTEIFHAQKAIKGCQRCAGLQLRMVKQARSPLDFKQFALSQGGLPTRGGIRYFYIPDPATPGRFKF
jgi:hypothetical protein